MNKVSLGGEAALQLMENPLDTAERVPRDGHRHPAWILCFSACATGSFVLGVWAQKLGTDLHQVGTR